ncbi:MAG: hypothetical protein LWW85_03520, partial [Marinilabiliales bacterium]|nr:hypothetical protein [Marinilabiliales bacterium]
MSKVSLPLNGQNRTKGRFLGIVIWVLIFLFNLTSRAAVNIGGDAVPNNLPANFVSTANEWPGGIPGHTDVTACAGNDVNINATPGGAVYAWAYSTDNTATWIPTPETTASIVLSKVDISMDQYYYRCTVDGVDQYFHLTVYAVPTVTNANTAHVCSGFSPNIGLTATVASTFTWTIGNITGSITGASAGSGATINQPLANPSNSVSGTVEYLVTPTSTTGSCAGSPYSIVVTVDPLPDIAFTGSTTLCSGTTTNLKLTSTAPGNISWVIGNNSGVTGAVAGSGSTISQNLTNTSHTTPATVEYIVTSVSVGGLCTGHSTTITVTVNPAPDVTSSSTTICSGTSPNLTLTASIPSTYTWVPQNNVGAISGASSGTGPLINQTLTDPSSSLSGSIDYVVTPKSSTDLCTGANKIITVNVNPLPIVTSTGTTICSGSSPELKLLATTPSTFAWTIGNITGGITGAVAGSGSTISQVLTNPSNNTVGTVEYNITPTSTLGGCQGNVTKIIVTVNPAPSVTTASTSLCSGLSPNLSLDASISSNYTWTIGTITGGVTGATAGSGSNINQVLTNPSNVTAGSVQYMVTPTSTAGGCTGTAKSIVLTVAPLPQVNSSNAYTICSGTGTNINLSATIPSNFSWTVGTITGSITGATSGSGSTLNQTLVCPVGSAGGSVIYRVVPTSIAGGCDGAPYNITVTVNPTPVVTSNATASVCSGKSANVSLTATVPSTFSWTVGTITGAITGASGGSGSTITNVLTNPSNSSAGTVVYKVTPTATTGGCTGAPFDITVTVNPTPVMTTDQNPPAICSTTSPGLSLGATTPCNFSWTIGTITGGITGATDGSGTSINQVLTNPSDTNTGTVTYNVTPTSITGGCVGASYPITITVNPSPTLTSPSSATICSSTSPNLALVANPAGGSFSWSVGTITGGVTGATAGSGTVINNILVNPSSSGVGTVQYLVTPMTSGGYTCATLPVTITVTPSPVVTNLSAYTICSGASTTISLTASTASTFSWTIGAITGGITGASSGAGTSINQVLTNPSSTQSGTVKYIVTPTSNPDGCAGNPYTITVTVNPGPTLNIPATYSICSNTNTNINLAATMASSFSWSVGATSGGITGATGGSGLVINQTLVNPSSVSSGTVDYVVTPTTTSGSCPGTPSTLTVTVNPNPSVTTPNTLIIASGSSTNMTLTATVPSTFSWTIGSITGGITGAVAGSGTAINQTLINPSTSSAGTVTYLVTPTGGGCSGAVYPIVVTVQPIPTVTASPTAMICSKATTNINLTSNIPSTFSWTVGTITGGVTGAAPGTGTSINQVLTNPSDMVAGTVAYIVTPTSVAGSLVGTPYTITVTVNPSPSLTNSNLLTVCSKISPNVSLTASIPSNFSWTVGTIAGGITGASSGSGGTINQALTNPSNLSAGTVDYIITPTSISGNCAGTPGTITATVNPAPSITNAATLTICNGSSPNIALTSSMPSNYSWTIGTVTGGVTGATAGVGSLINQVLTNPSASATGTVAFVVTPTSIAGNCVGNPFTITVSVLPSPSVTTSPTATTCNKVSPNIALSATVPSTFTWTVGAITGSITGASAGTGPTLNQVLTNPSNTTSGTVAYLVTPTSVTGSCTGNPYTITVTVLPSPDLNPIAPVTICSKTSPNIALSASVPCTYSWTIGTISGGITGASSGSGATINQVLTNPSGLTAGTVDYIVTPVSVTGNCAGAPVTITVTVNPAPVITTPNTATICSGSNTNIALASTFPANFTWTVGSVTGAITGAIAGAGNSIDQVLSNPSNTTSGTVTYLVTPSAAVGTCSGTAYAITVTVLPKPAVTNTAAASVCSGASPNVVLQSSIPSTFTWTIGAITGGITGASPGSGPVLNQVLTNPGNSASGTVAYVITPTSVTGGCIGNPFTLTVTVQPTPAITNVLSATICSKSSPGLALTASTASNFAWTIGTISGGITGATSGSGSSINQVLTNPSTTVPGFVEYLVTPTAVTGGCVGPQATVTINVNPVPVISTPATATACSGSSPNIALAASSPSTFSWTVGTVTGGITGASAGSGSNINQVLTNPSNTVSGTLTYVVTPTAIVGNCAGSPYSITVTVPPYPAVTTPAAASICSGGTTNIGLTATIPSTFTWVVGSVTGGITGASAGSGPTIAQKLTNPGNSADGTVAYIVTPTSVTGNCVGNPYTVTVTVHPVPSLTSATTATICSKGSPNLTLTASAASTFSWTIGTIAGGITGASAGSGTAINQALTNPSTTAAGTVEYLVTPVLSAGGCAGTPTSVVINVNPAPAVTNPATLSVCNGTSPNINLAASVPSTFVWTIGAITGGITGASAGSGSIINQVLTNASSSASGTVAYVVTPTAVTGGCAGNPYTITVTVTPTPVVTTPAVATVCSGKNTNIALSASVASSFSWSVGAVTGGIVGASAGSGAFLDQILSNPSSTTNGTVTYLVTPVSTSGGCPGAAYPI